MYACREWPSLSPLLPPLYPPLPFLSQRAAEKKGPLGITKAAFSAAHFVADVENVPYFCRLVRRIIHCVVFSVLLFPLCFCKIHHTTSCLIIRSLQHASLFPPGHGSSIPHVGVRLCSMGRAGVPSQQAQFSRSFLSVCNIMQ